MTKRERETTCGEFRYWMSRRIDELREAYLDSVLLPLEEDGPCASI